ncbi:MAG: PBP1A family penicillin-binding protein [Candidatus Binatia bacterium]
MSEDSPEPPLPASAPEEPRPAGARPARWTRRLLTFALLAVPPLLAGVVLWGWFLYAAIDRTLTEKFAGQRWDFPSKVWSDAYSLYPGLEAGEGLIRRLDRRGYRGVRDEPDDHGEYRVLELPPAVEIHLEPFLYPTHRERGRRIRLELDSSGRMRRIRSLDDGSDVYDAALEPVLLTGLHGSLREDRREMSLGEVPVPLVRAVILVEDRRFFEHHGFDPRGFARAMLANLRAMGVRQGGSTLTQQLMKNFFLSEDRTVGRKLREAAMAIVAERRFDKGEILEAYMNEIYLGQRHSVGVHGMWEAARFYFGREPRELTLGQIATLAGMIRAPNYYSPHTKPERALARRDVVLDVLYSTGEIDARTLAAARAETLGAVRPPPPPPGASHFIDFVREELADRYSSDVLTSQGYSIFTTLALERQIAAQRAVSEGLARLERDYAHLAEAGEARLEAALVAINPRTGAIVAMVGGRSYRDSQYNRVVEARRQPGSVFKPIVYLAAIGRERLGDVHYGPMSIVVDEPFEWEYDGKVWAPQNYERKFYGDVTIADALANSLNVATARVARDVGIERVRDLAVRLGVDPALPAYPAIALGGWEMSPLDVARVYSVFANAGLAAQLIAVSKVVDREGRTVEGHSVEIRRVISADDAYLMTSLLEGVVERGTARSLRAHGFHRSAAGKTGTTNENNDAWFAGYTPDLLTVVWVGFDRGAHLGLTGAAAALPIWADFMRAALDERPASTFTVPRGILFADVDPQSGGLAVSGCRHVVRQAFLEGEEPVTRCGLH